MGMAGSCGGGEGGSVAAASKAGVVGEMDSPIFLVEQTELQNVEMSETNRDVVEKRLWRFFWVL